MSTAGATPLGLAFCIGLPPEIPNNRLATVLPFSTGRALHALPTTPWPMLLRVLWPWSLLRKSMPIFAEVDWNDRRCLEVEVPAGNGVGTARAVARLYSVFAEGGSELGVGPETMAKLTAEPSSERQKDVARCVGVDGTRGRRAQTDPAHTVGRGVRTSRSLQPHGLRRRR